MIERASNRPAPPRPQPNGTTAPCATEPEAAAKQAGLRYVSDADPGIARRRAGKSFSYFDPQGRRITDPAVRERIRKLAIPPAYNDVWICCDPNGHLQATGRDKRGRKQYRYHPDWRSVRDETKFTRMLTFGRTLPTIRERVKRHLGLHGLPREKVLATVVRLLETSLIRVGNEEYARDNKTYGLTTLRDQHVDIEGSSIEFEFRAKTGRRQALRLRDQRLARIVKACQDIPGQELFQYVDENGERHPISSHDVNEYLKDISGEDFTAKDFRTWAATVLAVFTLREFEDFDSGAAARRNITQAIETVARTLGNTVTICRKSYVHPAVVDAYLDGTLIDRLKRRIEEDLRRGASGLSAEEAAVLAFLQDQRPDEPKAEARRKQDS